jgi:hypothetical protein
MNQQVPSVPSGWQSLARGEQENDQVSLCRAGHIHLDYGNFTVRFNRAEFLALARMVAEAAARLDTTVSAPPAAKSGLSIGFSNN